MLENLVLYNSCVTIKIRKNMTKCKQTNGQSHSRVYSFVMLSTAYDQQTSQWNNNSAGLVARARDIITKSQQPHSTNSNPNVFDIALAS